jgi:hypothetical protein
LPEDIETPIAQAHAILAVQNQRKKHRDPQQLDLFSGRKITTYMSAQYDLRSENRPKILRPQIGKNYDVKKSAYKLMTITAQGWRAMAERSGAGF